MQLTDSWLARVAEGSPPLPTAAQILHSHAAAAWASRVRTEVRHRDTVSSLAIDGAMILMVAELAQLAGVHPTHLLKTFRRHHGVTISNYVRQRRIQRARLDVANGKRPLSMIALDAGFSDQSHFTGVFRQTFGETPGQYARSLRGR